MTHCKGIPSSARQDASKSSVADLSWIFVFLVELFCEWIIIITLRSTLTFATKGDRLRIARNGIIMNVRYLIATEVEHLTDSFWLPIYCPK